MKIGDKVQWGVNFYDDTKPSGTGTIEEMYEIGEVYNVFPMAKVKLDNTPDKFFLLLKISELEPLK